MKKAIIKLIFCMLFVGSQLYAMSVYEKIDSMQPVLDIIEQLHREGERDVYVFLDLDQTLINPIDPYFHPANYTDFEVTLGDKFIEYEEASKTYHSVNDLLAHILSQAKMHITDSHIPKIIKKIKEYGFKALIITASSWGMIRSCNKTVEEIKLAYLNSVLNGADCEDNVDFGPFWEDLHLENLFTGENKDTPLFFKDMVFSGCLSKGKVISNLLNYIYEKFNHFPRHVLVVDNVGRNVVDMVLGVHEFLKERGINRMINCYGFEYSRWNYTPFVNGQRLNRQIDHFFKEKVWSSNIE